MSTIKKAYFAGGCFWCTEAIFNRLKYVLSVNPGYSGGFNKRSHMKRSVEVILSC